jgi:signal transduction histidine kinase
LEDREGHLWFGTRGGGVSRYDGQDFTTFTTKNGLAHNAVLSILEDQEGHLWFGTIGGVSRYDGEEFTTFTTKNGLAHNNLRSMLEDREGHLWFGTDGGVASRYDGQVFQTLTHQDGLTGQSVRSILQDQEGTIWFATYNGVTRYRPPPPSPPPIHIDAVVADRRYAGASELALPSSTGLVTFEFHGMSFKTRPAGMVYRYHLAGYDKAWKATNARHVEYQDLPRGTYTFEVEAVDRDLVHSEAPATMTLHVHLPYERIAWISALSIALLLAVWQAGRIVQRDRRLQEANRQIQEANHRKSDFLARMSHDLRTPMNAIIGYTRILLRQAKDQLNQRQYRNLDNIQISANNLLTLINDILDLSKIEAGRIDIKPEAVDLKQLATECIASFASLVKPGVQLEQQLADVNPTYTDADRVRRVVMNLLSNALKFTAQGSITVSSKPVDDWVELSVADTGSGIPPEDLPHIFDEFRQVESQGGKTQEGTGLGLSIAKKSVELLGGTISVESEMGKGTKFTLRIQDYQEKEVE